MLERRTQVLVKVDTMQLGFMPGKETTDALFAMRGMLKKCKDKNKMLKTCLENTEKAFDKSSKKDGGVGNKEERFTRKNSRTFIIGQRQK